MDVNVWLPSIENRQEGVLSRFIPCCGKFCWAGVRRCCMPKVDAKPRSIAGNSLPCFLKRKIAGEEYWTSIEKGATKSVTQKGNELEAQT